MSTFGDAAVFAIAQPPAGAPPPAAPPPPLAIDTTSASLSLTVQVARSGTPSSENIVYFVDSDSITHRNFSTVAPQVATHRCGRRRFSSLESGSSTEAIVLRSSIGLLTLELVS